MFSRRALIIGGSALAVGAATGYYVWNEDGSKAKNSLRIGFVGRDEISTLDPAQAGTESPIAIVWNTHDRLVQQNSAGKFVPMLAKSWSVSGDRSEWRFRIRQGVKFHAKAGQAQATLTPNDVVQSIVRAVRVPGYGRTLLADILPGAGAVADGAAKAISGLTVVGNEVVFKLSKPFNFLLDRLATSFLSIVPAGSSDSGPPPPGTGAYSLLSFDKARQEVILQRNPNDWRTASPDAPNTVYVRGIASEALGAAELRSGGIDIAEFHSSALAVMRAQSQGAYEIQEYQHTELRLIALNQQVAPFNGADSAKVGQALNLAIDRDALIKRLGGGVPFAGPDPTRKSYQLAFDQGRAKSLVQELPAAVRSLEMLVEPVDEARVLAEMLVEQWRAVGMSITPIYGRSDFFPNAAGGKYQMALAYYGPYVPSTEQYLWMYRKSAIPVPNVMRFDNAEFEQAFEEFVTLEGAASDQAANKAIERLVAKAPTIWIAKPPRMMATRKKLSLERTAGLPDYSSLRWS